MTRPVVHVLAGVDGPGKNSVGGHLLERDRLTWFNPSTFVRELMASTGCDKETANGYAWQVGTVPDLVLVLEMENRQVISPAPMISRHYSAPEWSKSILEAALRCGTSSDSRPPGS